MKDSKSIPQGDPDLMRRITCYQRLAGSASDGEQNIQQVSASLRKELEVRRMCLVEADHLAPSMEPKEVSYFWQLPGDGSLGSSLRNFAGAVASLGSGPLKG